MPLLDHFHPPLHGPRRWEGFHHSWAALIARRLNQGILPDDYYAEPEITLGPELEIAVATMGLTGPGSRLTFAAKCAGYLRHGTGVVIVDVVTAPVADDPARLVLRTQLLPADAWRERRQRLEEQAR
jgi:hypothetical protein